MLKRLAGAALIFLTACSGPSVLVIGESVEQPEPPPPMVEVVVSAGDDLQPVGGAWVRFGSNDQVTDDAGIAATEWYGEPITVEVGAPGFVTSVIDIVERSGAPTAVELAPVVLSGQVVATDGRPLPLTTVTMGNVLAVTDDSGSFQISRAVPGSLEASRPAWRAGMAQWDGTAPTVQLVLDPIDVRALRVSGTAAGDADHWQEILDLAERTSVNALVLDTKDEAGAIFRETDVAEANAIGAVQELFDVERAIADMDELDLYKITRIVAFQDNPRVTARPDLAAVDIEDGLPWEGAGGRLWLDPTNRDAWEYPIALAIEACELGFDEIQFDYVRFPSDGPVQRLSFTEEVDADVRVATIAEFLGTARDRLNALGCAVSADIFAIVVSAEGEQGIGQRPEELSAALDVISPMIYPSHYGSGWLNFENPNDYPAEVVGDALDDALPRLQGPAILRPWLQTYPYGRTEIAIEINEAVDRDLGWMLWSAGAQFSESWLPPNEG